MSSSDENKGRIRLMIEEGLNAGNFALLEQHVKPDYVAHVPGMSGLPHGPGAIRETISMWRGAFDDWHMTIEDLVAEGDFVAVRYTTTGTHTGPLFGIPATGRRIKMEAMQLHRFEDERVAETWVADDLPAILMQLGVVEPPMAGPPE